MHACGGTAGGEIIFAPATPPSSTFLLVFSAIFFLFLPFQNQPSTRDLPVTKLVRGVFIKISQASGHLPNYYSTTIVKLRNVFSRYFLFSFPLFPSTPKRFFYSPFFGKTIPFTWGPPQGPVRNTFTFSGSETAFGTGHPPQLYGLRFFRAPPAQLWRTPSRAHMYFHFQSFFSWFELSFPNVSTYYSKTKSLNSGLLPAGARTYSGNTTTVLHKKKLLRVAAVSTILTTVCPCLCALRSLRFSRHVVLSPFKVLPPTEATTFCSAHKTQSRICLD